MSAKDEQGELWLPQFAPIVGDWPNRAACAGLDVNAFYPTRGDNKGLRAALAICGACEVREECLRDNLHIEDGVWGGTSAAERKRLRSKANVQAA